MDFCLEITNEAGTNFAIKINIKNSTIIYVYFIRYWELTDNCLE